MKEYHLNIVSELIIVLSTILYAYNNITTNTLQDKGELNIILLAIILFFIVSLFFNKYKIAAQKRFLKSLGLYSLVIILTFIITYTALYFLETQNQAYRVFKYLRVILGLEIIWLSVITYIKTFYINPIEHTTSHILSLKESLKTNCKFQTIPGVELLSNQLFSSFKISKKTSDFINDNLSRNQQSEISDSTNINVDGGKCNPALHLIIDDKDKLNNVRYINKYLELLNTQIKTGGYYVCYLETLELRERRILDKFPVYFNRIVYFTDFIVHRVLPKIYIINNIYFYLSQGRNRALSLAEALGRLNSCGFKIINHQVIDNLHWIISQRAAKPHFNLKPTYRPLIKLRRIGKNGILIYVFKFRTMYPFSEYIQDYAYNLYGSHNNKKITKDFRVTVWGKFLRKYWIDELPMLLNLLKGDLKLVGVRPLSEYIFSKYPEDLRLMRIKTKPGLIPPTYADLPKDEDEFYNSERAYIIKYQNSPYRTDITYFTKIVYNIIFKKLRSS